MQKSHTLGEVAPCTCPKTPGGVIKVKSVNNPICCTCGGLVVSELVQVQRKFQARNGTTYQADCPCGKLFITCNNFAITESGEQTAQLKEVFIRLGKAGGCATALTESIGKLISHYLQEGGDLKVILKSLQGVSCHLANGSSGSDSCISTIAEVLKEHTKGGEEE